MKRKLPQILNSAENARQEAESLAQKRQDELAGCSHMKRRPKLIEWGQGNW